VKYKVVGTVLVSWREGCSTKILYTYTGIIHSAKSLECHSSISLHEISASHAENIIALLVKHRLQSQQQQRYKMQQITS